MTDELTRFNVVSSRVRLARNVNGLPFPSHAQKNDYPSFASLVEAVDSTLKGIFDYEKFYVRELSPTRIKALVERHIISPALARNSSIGAAIVERNEKLAVMINEEDHIREQSVEDGFDLEKAYSRLNAVDDTLISALPIAFDNRLGFLTACPTNLGTGMRASTMLFLPALRLAGAIEDTVKVFTGRYGLTLRGVYGEGSSALGDTYQLSNTRSLGLNEESIIEITKKATIAMCTAEAVAREKLIKENGIAIKDKIYRSFGTLKNAYSLTSEELMSLVSDAKLGVILGILPLKDTKPLDRLAVLFTAASLSLKIGACPPAVRDITRAKLVKEILSEVI